MSRWKGKWALVTGASAGIGMELARQLAAGATNLVLTARRRDRLEQLAAELAGKYGVKVEICVADLAKPSAPNEVFNFTEMKRLTIDLLVNNAGFGVYGEFHKAQVARQIEMVQVNISAVVHLTHLYLAPMVARRSGDILIVASTAAFQAVPYITVYAATKAFDLLFAEGLAEEVARYGVRVCALCPGTTNTEFQQVAGQPERLFRVAETAEKVARVGLRALERGKSCVISGAMNYLQINAERLAPRRLVTRSAERLFRPADLN
jgi:short-subunit dehydrogenase